MVSDQNMRPLSEMSVNFDTRRKPVKESDRVAGPYPYYGASGVVDHVDDYLFDGEFVLVAEDGENLRTRNTPVAFRATGKFWVNNHAHIIQGNSAASTRYLEYALLNADISPYLTGAVMPKLTQGNLNRILLPCPPRRAQDQVVAMLGALDDRIDLLRQTNTTLEAIAQALFKSWFVDFYPVRAKAEGREPEGMDAATAALFPDTLEEWRHNFSEHKVQSLSDTRVLAIGDGYRAKNSELGTPGVAFLRAGDLLAGRISPTRDLLSESALSAAKGKLALAGDTVFTSKGTIGRFAYVPNLNETVVYSPQVCFWRSLDRNVVAPEYLHFWMRSPRFAVQVDRVRGNAAIMDFVSLGDQKAMRLDLPSLRIQQRFAEIVGPILERVAVNRTQSDQLASLRDTLLPRLISGKLRIPEAEELLEDVRA